MAFFLGLDIGGTKTACVIGDERATLGASQGPSAKATRVPPAEVRRILSQVIHETAARASVDLHGLAHVCVGSAGASVPEVVSLLTTVIADLTPAPVTIVGDNLIAHQAAFNGAPGVLVISGTGSIASGRNAEGRSARAGGWGPLISDEGSAYWIGHEAVRLALRHADAGQRTPLMELVFRKFAVAAPAELAAIASPDFASLAEDVCTLADSGERDAHAIAERAGAELARLALAVIRRIWPLDSIAPVALAGTVALNCRTTQEAFASALSLSQPVQVTLCSAQPVEGALSLARRLALRSAAI